MHSDLAEFNVPVLDELLVKSLFSFFNVVLVFHEDYCESSIFAFLCFYNHVAFSDSKLVKESCNVSFCYTPS
jgi:hypothetical protein